MMNQNEKRHQDLGRKLFSVYKSKAGFEKYRLVPEPGISQPEAFVMMLEAVAEGILELRNLVLREIQERQ